MTPWIYVGIITGMVLLLLAASYVASVASLEFSTALRALTLLLECDYEAGDLAKKLFPKKQWWYDERKLTGKAIENLIKKGYVRLQEREGKVFVVITELGRQPGHVSYRD